MSCGGTSISDSHFRLIIYAYTHVPTCHHPSCSWVVCNDPILSFVLIRISNDPIFDIFRRIADPILFFFFFFFYS